MAKFSNPSEIARETLKQLMSRRMPPSPDNYLAIYNEIAGVTDKPVETFPERELKSLLVSLPKENPAQQRLSRQLEQALKAASWEEYRQSVVDFISEHTSDSDLA